MEVPLDRDDSRPFRHEIKNVPFEPLLSFDDIRDVGTARLEFDLFSLEDLAGEFDGPFAGRVLVDLLREAPVLLFDRPYEGHDLCLELLEIDVGARRGDRVGTLRLTANVGPD